MKRQPAVTVLLPAYNAQAWLDEALRSVLRQSFRDLELLIIDDGSTDGTAELVRRYADDRIRIVRHERNRGLIESLNEGIDLARGRFVARMDADDIAHPRRLERQLAFLEQRADVGICGTWFRASGRRRQAKIRPPMHHDDIAATLFFRSAFAHPTVMFRRQFLDQNGLRYDPQAHHAEDYDLWVRARERTRLANLPEFLLEYRAHADQVSARYPQPQSGSAAQVRLKQLAVMLPAATEEEKSLHLRTCDGHVFSSSSELLEARSWLDFLREANRRAGMFPGHAFGGALASAWFHCCFRTTLPPHRVHRLYVSRRYSEFGIETMRRHFVFALGALRQVLASAG
jgi:hypothetical protein